MARSRLLLLASALVVTSCQPSSPQARPASAKADPASPEPPRADGGKAPDPAVPFKKATKPLSRAEAEQYSLSLINRDRKKHGLKPVSWDATAARAAERHVRDMVSNGFTAHWGTDGSPPEHRYTDAGGEDIVTENVGCFADGKRREPDFEGPFDPDAVEHFHEAFMAEVPPNDGHRRNVLEPLHNKVGLALARAQGGTKTACLAQEFIDDYGSYAPIAKRAKAGDTIKVQGEISAPAKFGGIGLAVVPMPKGMTAKQLIETGSYQMPNPFITYFGKGFKTPKPVDVDGNKFSLDLPLTNLKGPGLYHVQVFAQMGSSKDLVPVSLRTVEVP